MPEAERTMPATHRTDNPHIPDDPIGFLRTEIYRQRVACNTLEALSSGGGNGGVRADAARVLQYLVEDFPQHMADLEECLFPILLQRAELADGLVDTLDRFREERDRDMALTQSLVSALRDVADGAAPVDDLRDDAGAFAASQRRCLSLENDEILPMAEQRLSEDDVAALGRALALRRGATPTT